MRRISRFNRPACDSVRCPPIPSINADIPARSVVDFPDLSIRSNVRTNGGDHSITSLATLSRVWKLNDSSRTENVAPQLARGTRGPEWVDCGGGFALLSRSAGPLDNRQSSL